MYQQFDNIAIVLTRPEWSWRLWMNRNGQVSKKRGRWYLLFAVHKMHQEFQSFQIRSRWNVSCRNRSFSFLQTRCTYLEVYLFTYVCTYVIYVCTYVIYVCTYVTYVCTYVCTYVTYVCTYVTYVCTYVTYVCTYVPRHHSGNKVWHGDYFMKLHFCISILGAIFTRNISDNYVCWKFGTNFHQNIRQIMYLTILGNIL
jgi:hypothetical protein